MAYIPHLPAQSPLQVCLLIPIYGVCPSLACPSSPFRSVSSSLYMTYIPLSPAPSPFRSVSSSLCMTYIHPSPAPFHFRSVSSSLYMTCIPHLPAQSPLQVSLLIPIYGVHPSLACPSSPFRSVSSSLYMTYIPPSPAPSPFRSVSSSLCMTYIHPSPAPFHFWSVSSSLYMTCIPHLPAQSPLQVCLLIRIYGVRPSFACPSSPFRSICTSLYMTYIPPYVCPIPFRSVSSSLYMAYIPPLSAPSPNQACLLIPIYGLHPLLACPIPPSGLSPHPPAPARSQGLRVGALSSPVCTHTAINICLDAVVILLLSFLLLH